jgi:hypothetical protein
MKLFMIEKLRKYYFYGNFKLWFFTREGILSGDYKVLTRGCTAVLRRRGAIRFFPNPMTFRKPRWGAAELAPENRI